MAEQTLMIVTPITPRYPMSIDCYVNYWWLLTSGDKRYWGIPFRYPWIQKGGGSNILYILLQAGHLPIVAEVLVSRPEYTIVFGAVIANLPGILFRRDGDKASW